MVDFYNKHLSTLYSYNNCVSPIQRMIIDANESIDDIENSNTVFVQDTDNIYFIIQREVPVDDSLCSVSNKQNLYDHIITIYTLYEQTHKLGWKLVIYNLKSKHTDIKKNIKVVVDDGMFINAVNIVNSQNLASHSIMYRNIILLDNVAFNAVNSTIKK